MKTLNQKVSLFLFVFAGVYLFFSYQIKEYPYVPVDADLVPKSLGYILLVLAGLLFFDKKSESEEEKKKRQVPKSEILVMGTVGVMIFIYITLFEIVGFLLMTALFIFGCASFLGYRKWVSSILVSILFPSILYYLFSYLLQIQLPQGVLPF